MELLDLKSFSDITEIKQSLIKEQRSSFQKAA